MIDTKNSIQIDYIIKNLYAKIKFINIFLNFKEKIRNKYNLSTKICLNLEKS